MRGCVVGYPDIPSWSASPHTDGTLGHKGHVGEFEQVVLLAILQLGERAHAPRVAKHLESTIGRKVTRGALYSCLNQLEKKDFLEWTEDVPTPERGGHTRRLYEVTGAGLRALRLSREGLLTLWRGLDDVLGPA